MATQIAPLPARLTLTEDSLTQLQQLADRQHVSLSQALAQAIQISDIVVSQAADPKTKILVKRGDKYKELTVGWREALRA